MSIWCSDLGFDDEFELPAPLIYQGSHVLPDENDPRGGSFDLAHVPGFIGPEGAHVDDPDETCQPFLRVALHGWDDVRSTVVLDGEQVHRLRDELTVWLARAGVEDGDWVELEQKRRERWGER